MDLLSNMVSIIKMGYNLKLQKVEILNSSLCVKVLLLLYKLGYIKGYTVKDKKSIIVFLKYINNKPCIRNIYRVSTPGRRVYLTLNKLKKNLRRKNNGFYIFSTNRGLLTDEEVLTFNLGGEVLLKVS